MSRPEDQVPNPGIGWLSMLTAVLVVPWLATQGLVAAQAQRLALGFASADPTATALLGVAGGASVVMTLLAAVSLRQQLRRARRSRGRLRLSLTFGGVLLATVGGGIAAALSLHTDEVLLGAALGSGPSAQILLSMIVAGLGAGTATLGALSCWWLLSERSRRGFWLVLDAVLLVAVGYAVTQLPTQPPTDAPGELTLPVIRHVVTALGLIRLIVRLLPPALDMVELFGFRALVAARHLRAKKSGFLATIAVLSIFAVMLSCTALTVTLSVMGGFRQDLKRKILGNNAHIVIDRDQGTIEGWGPLVQAAAKRDGVVGASPFVSGEVMISSASNLGTAVLRGIDLGTVGNVNDLQRNLRQGKLEYLEHPEKLLDLPSDFMGGGSPAVDIDTDDAGQDPLPSSPEEAAAKAELEEKLAELEQMLNEQRRSLEASGKLAKERPRDVLPGIVIGQELARSLRLYVGDEVNVVAPLGALGPSGPMPKSRPFRIAGIFYSGMYEYDMKFTYVELSQGQRFLGTGDAISGIEVKVADTERAPSIARAIKADLGRDELRVQDWQQLNSRLFGALELEKLAMFITLGIAILVASFCIAGTLTLMVQEKGREVAVMKAMGAGDRTVVGVFVIEGGLIGVLGAALGLFLGYMLCFAAEHFGIKMNPEVYYIERLPVHIDPTEFVLTGVSAVLICLLITIYPALQASRLRPVDALRYE